MVVVMVDLWSRQFLEDLGILGKPGYPGPDSEDNLREFHEAFAGKDWIAVMDDGSLARLYNVRYIDTIFVIDSEGNIVFGGSNVVTVESLREGYS